MNNLTQISFLFILCFSISTLSAQHRKVAITIDDLLATPADESQYKYISEKLLETLVFHNIEATGFVNEMRLYSHNQPDSNKISILELWLKNGMDLGNHTFSHVYINNTSLDDYKKDVLRGEEITRPLMEKHGKQLRYFRHPQLRTGPTDNYRKELDSFLERTGYTVAPVTIDNDEYIYAYCYAKAKENNDIELMERIASDYIKYMTSIFEFYEQLSLEYLGYELPQVLLLHANNLNADYLNDLIKLMKSRGYVFVSMETALQDDSYSKKEGTHSRGLSWIQRWMIADGLKPKSHPPISTFIEKLYQELR